MRDNRGRVATDDDYGIGDLHTIDCDDLGLIDEDELTARLVTAFESPSYRPPRLPAVALELTTLSQNPNVSFAQIEALLEQDAILAGEVLSIGRSLGYAGRAGTKVRGIRDALVRIGTDQLRDVVMQAAMTMTVFRSSAYKRCMERLRDHSRATAHLCRLLSRYTSLEEDQAFLAGLLHDVGIAGILLVLADTQRGEKPPELETLWPAVDRAHTKAGECMVKLWGLPIDVSTAVESHARIVVEGYAHPLGAIACLGEWLADQRGAGLVPTNPTTRERALLQPSGIFLHEGLDRCDSLVLSRARDALQITEDTLQLVLADAASWEQPVPA